MAVIRRTPAAAVKPAAATAARPALRLPTEPNVPSHSLSDYTILLYGAKKIGKTSICARFPKAIFLALEPGTKALAVHTASVRDWAEFEGYIALLEKDTTFSNIIVDTIDLAYEYAFEAVCKRKMIGHPSEENDYGATWKEITETFRKAVLRLINSGKGVIFVSHDVEREVELRDGRKIDRVQPTMSKQAMSVVEALVDVIVNYCYEDDRRILRLDGSQSMIAGCRIEEHFVRKGGQPRTAGDRVLSVDMGRTAQEAYDNLIKAFNNEQEKVDVSTPAPVLVKKEPPKPAAAAPSMTLKRKT